MSVRALLPRDCAAASLFLITRLFCAASICCVRTCLGLIFYVLPCVDLCCPAFGAPLSQAETPADRSSAMVRHMAIHTGEKSLTAEIGLVLSISKKILSLTAIWRRMHQMDWYEYPTSFFATSLQPFFSCQCARGH